MRARIHKILGLLADTFWLLPGGLVLVGIAGALLLVELDRSGSIPPWMLATGLLYSGGGTGARTLLGAVASSTIGVAGTAFSITIAALSLAAGQMGPRLLRNFTHDRGNQMTLGVFLGTFAYSLVVLRTVRTEDEEVFTPHVALSVGILLAFVCVGTLIYFVGHMAGRINVDTVVELVSEDVSRAIARLTTQDPQPLIPAADALVDPAPVSDSRRGYLQLIDEESLANWAAANGTVIHFLVRPGDYVFPGAPFALVAPPVKGAEAAIRSATALGATRASSVDLEYAIRQLVEVAVRALSPGINDPHTAISVLDRLGAALCDVATTSLSTGVTLRDGRPVLIVPAVDYDGLTDAMFHLIRQNAAGSPAVLIRMIEVLSAVATCERSPARSKTLERHADLVMSDAERTVPAVSDLEDVRKRHSEFDAEKARSSTPWAVGRSGAGRIS